MLGVDCVNSQSCQENKAINILVVVVIAECRSRAVFSQGCCAADVKWCLSPHFATRKQRLREVNLLTQGHTASDRGPDYGSS